MIDFTVYLLSPFLIAFITSLTLYYLLKRYIEDKQIELKDEFLDYLHSEEGQKLIYSVGALIGNGARAGLGIQGSAKGGKMNLQDLIMQVAAGFLQGKLQMPQGSGGQQAQQKSENLKFEY